MSFDLPFALSLHEVKAHCHQSCCLRSTGIRPHQNMTRPRTDLLSLPLELRNLIYINCFDGYLPNHRALPLVCHQTHAETLPMLLQKPHDLNTFESFVDWVNAGSPRLLPLVTNVFLRGLTKSCLHPLPTTQGELVPDIASHSERRLVQNSISLLPNLRDLRLTVIHESAPLQHQPHYNPHQNQGWDKAQAALLATIAESCPKLESLTLVTDLIGLECLESFRNLGFLAWSGYSLSSPQETLQILNSLPYLHTIRLERFDEQLDREHYSVYTYQLRQYISFTGAVLRALKPLRSFQISHTTTRIRSDFLTVAMIQALASHGESLKRLEILCSGSVERDVIDEVMALATSLRRITHWTVGLQYGSPFEQVDLKSCIPASVRHCHFHLNSWKGCEEVTQRYECGNLLNYHVGRYKC